MAGYGLLTHAGTSVVTRPSGAAVADGSEAHLQPMKRGSMLSELSPSGSDADTTDVDDEGSPADGMVRHRVMIEKGHQSSSSAAASSSPSFVQCFALGNAGVQSCMMGATSASAEQPQQ